MATHTCIQFAAKTHPHPTAKFTHTHIHSTPPFTSLPHGSSIFFDPCVRHPPICRLQEACMRTGVGPPKSSSTAQAGGSSLSSAGVSTRSQARRALPFPCCMADVWLFAVSWCKMTGAVLVLLSHAMRAESAVTKLNTQPCTRVEPIARAHAAAVHPCAQQHVVCAAAHEPPFPRPSTHLQRHHTGRASCRGAEC